MSADTLIHHLENIIQMGRKDGRVLMDNHLYELYGKCAVTYDTAITRAHSPEQIARQKSVVGG